MAVINNSSSNTLISGTNGHDSIENESGNDVTIKTGTGNDTIINGLYNGERVSIDGGADDDYIDNGYFKIVFSRNGSSKVTINGGTGNDLIYNGNKGNYSSISGGAGNDTITNSGSNVTINTGKGNNFVSVYGGSNIEIIGSTGKDTAYNYASNVTIDTGAGNDSIYAEGTNITVIGGTGNDSIVSKGTNVLFKYTEGDGNDRIEGISMTDTLQIGGGKGTYSSQASGEDIIVTVGDGKITLVGAVGKSVYIEGKKSSASKNTWKLNGTTATYGTSGKTLVTVKGVKSTSGLSVSGKVVTVKKSSLGTDKVTISDGYTLKLGSDVPAPKTTKAWSLNNATATYNQTTTAGYKLSNNAITYTKKSSKTLATVSGVKSLDGLSIKDKIVTVSKKSLGTSKVTISDGYTLNLGSDVDKPAMKKAAWSLKSSTASYKSSYKTAGYTLASDSKSISYSKATTAETLASIKGANSMDGLSVSGKKITLKNSALNKKVTVSGGYEFDFASDYKSATITGSSNADSITANGTKVSINGGKGNDTIKILGNSNTVAGGDGADIFIYKAGKSGVISDYSSEDKISIASGTAEFEVSGENIIISGKITVKGGKDKTITYSDDSGKNKKYKYEEPVDDETVILPKNYSKETYTMGDDTFNVDASKVRLDIEIVGNKFANEIIGSSQNDTIIGGKANDTLYGGDGADVFVWNKGDGNDKILDYYEEDIIEIVGDNVKEPFKTSSDDLIINLASKSKITVKGGAYRVISYRDAKGEHVYSHFVEFDEEGIEVTLKSNYPEKKSFEASYYADYAEELAVIDASEVVHKMNIVGNSVANSIKGTNDEDTIDGGNHNDTIYGMDGDDSLIGGAGKDYLYGGAGNDTLWGGKGNDYLYGNEGKDTFIYYPGEGTDKIFDYNPNDDTIKLMSGTVDNAEAVGTDVVFTVGNGKIILDGAAGQYAEVIDGFGKVVKYIPKTRP